MTLEISTPRSAVFTVVLGVYLALWLVQTLLIVPAFFRVILTFGNGFGSSFNVLNIVFSSVYFVIWLLAAYVWLRATFGMERVRVTPRSLEVKTKRLWLERAEKFDVEQIERLRALPIHVPHWIAVLLGGQPSLAFDHGAQTVRFGRGMDEAEARQTLERILEKFPAYRSRLAMGDDLLRARLRDAEQSD